MQQLSKFKEKKQLYYIAALKRQDFYTLALGWNASKLSQEHTIIRSKLPSGIVLSTGNRNASVLPSIQSVLAVQYARSLLAGQSEWSTPNDITLILSSPCNEFTKDIKVVIECKSKEIIEKCKELGIWED